MATRRLPVLSGRKVIAALQRAGFDLDRIRGSHHVMRHPGPPVRAVSIPVHGNTPLPRGTLKAIVEQSGLGIEEFMKFL